MNILIVKLGASGDVVRTTVLLHVLKGEVFWLTSDRNIDLLKGIPNLNAIKWSERDSLLKSHYELVINLEDSEETSSELQKFNYYELYGAYLDSKGKMSYTDNSRDWFDLSIISRFGVKEADKLKLQNRQSYQELIFKGLGYQFRGEPYLLPETASSDLSGDIAIAQNAGSVWPMKNWAFYEELAALLSEDGFKVDFLPFRKTMLEHLADVRNHKYLISGDSLPMHFALGSKNKCLSIFICTSPWEIHDYGIQKKIVSPDLDKYFYRRDFVPDAVRSIPLYDVYNEFKNLTERTL